jgi:hypothetical protein
VGLKGFPDFLIFTGLKGISVICQIKRNFLLFTELKRIFFTSSLFGINDISSLLELKGYFLIFTGLRGFPHLYGIKRNFLCRLPRNSSLQD